MSDDGDEGLPQAVRDGDAAADEALNQAQSVQAGAPQAQPSQDGQPASAAPVARNTGVQSEPARPETVSREEYDQLLHRWQSFKGTYKSAMDRIAAQDAKLLELQTQIENLGKPAAKPGHLRHLKDEEVAEFNPDTLDTQGRIARGAAEEVVDASEKRIAEMVDRKIAALNHAVAPAAPAQTAWDFVEASMPGARAMDKADQGWHDFLSQPDSFDPDVTRLDKGRKAVAENDGVTLLDLVLEYRRGSGTARSASVRLQIKPDTGAGGGGNAPAGQRIWKESEVRKFFASVAKGTFHGTDQDADALEREIDTAVEEGRYIADQ